MRVLIDCSRIRSGGGLQGALALVQNAAATSGIEWHLALTHEMAGQVPPHVLKAFSTVSLPPCSSIQGSKVLGPFKMRILERHIRPEVVYSYYGPVYWRATAPHVVGFAQAYLIYPELNTYRWFTVSGKFRRWMTMTAARRSFLQADFLTVETLTVHRRVAQVLDFPASRIFVVPNTYSPLFESGITEHRATPRDGMFTLLVPSDYLPHKNLGLIPRVARELENQGHNGYEFVFTLPTSSAGWQAIRCKGRELGVEHRLRTVGKVPHARLSAYYSLANAVFLPTLLECSTAVYPESFLAKVPLLSSRTDFARELCGDAALYFDPESPEEAAMAVSRVMRDADLRSALVTAGEAQLTTSYVTPREKWELQLACIKTAAQLGRRTS